MQDTQEKDKNTTLKIVTPKGHVRKTGVPFSGSRGDGTTCSKRHHETRQPNKRLRLSERVLRNRCSKSGSGKCGYPTSSADMSGDNSCPICKA